MAFKGVQDNSAWGIVSPNESRFNDNMAINGIELKRGVSGQEHLGHCFTK